MIFEYEGHLTDYYETGFESLALILQDNRGITPNPDYDPASTTWPTNVPKWHSLHYALFFRGGEEIEVYRPDGTVEFRGKLTKNRAEMARLEYRYAFIPNEVSLETWLSWFREGRNAKAWSKEPPLAENPEFLKK